MLFQHCVLDVVCNENMGENFGDEDDHGVVSFEVAVLIMFVFAW